MQTGLGGRLTLPLRLGSVALVPQAYAFYQHEFANGSRGLVAGLSQGGGAFTYRSAAAGRDYALLGGSLTAKLSGNLYAQVNYSADVGLANALNQYLNAGLRWEF